MKTNIARRLAISLAVLAVAGCSADAVPGEAAADLGPSPDLVTCAERGDCEDAGPLPPECADDVACRKPGRPERCCNGRCVDIGSDSLNCGKCGKECPMGPQRVCVAGVCGGAPCNAGFADCDGVPSNGCESNLNNSDSCGACGIECKLPPNGTLLCINAECSKLICEQNFADCNQNLADGCETVTGRDPANCGACGVKCQVGAHCIEGMCI